MYILKDNVFSVILHDEMSPFVCNWGSTLKRSIRMGFFYFIECLSDTQKGELHGGEKTYK